MSSNSIFPISKQSIIVNPSSRLIIKLPVNTFDSGITGGDVIRFDTVGNKYKKSLADTSSNAEVFGIVENINSDGSANVVINGSINYPESKLVDKAVVGEEINLGGNDVYFLSGYTAGLLENKITDDKIVIKPLLQKAPHGAYNGIFRNYLGYKQGNLNSVEIQTLEFFISFSDDLTKLITVSETLDKVFVYSISYSSLVFTTTLLDTIEFNTLSGDSIEWDIETTDAKISNNGYDILIFTKQNNKIFHINRQSGVQLKAQIDTDLTGNAVDKLWAVDDEISSITVSTVAMSLSINDDYMAQTSREISSKIKYYRRAIDGKNKFKWKLVNTGTAPGFVTSFHESALYEVAEPIAGYSGVFRTNNIKCKGKNYILTTKTLISDQINYSSKKNGYLNNRYNNSFYNFLDLVYNAASIKVMSTIEGSTIQTSISQQNNGAIFIGEQPISTPYDSIEDAVADNQLLSVFANIPNNRSYKCSFGVRNFRITKKQNNKYIKDFSCLNNSSFAYYFPINVVEAHYRNDFEIFYPSGISYCTKLVIQENSKFSTAPFSVQQDAIWSSCSCSDSFFILGFLYNYINQNNQNKNLIILKFPINSHEEDSIFDYFEYSTKYNSVVPNPNNYGIISSFKSRIEQEISGISIKNIDMIHGPSIENPSFFNDEILSLININQLNSFELHTSNDRYFICTSTYTLIWTYSSGTYVIKDIANLDQYKFSYSGDGEFFIKNNKILRYDSATQEFIDITVV